MPYTSCSNFREKSSMGFLLSSASQTGHNWYYTHDIAPVSSCSNMKEQDGLSPFRCFSLSRSFDGQELQRFSFVNLVKISPKRPLGNLMKFSHNVQALVVLYPNLKTYGIFSTLRNETCLFLESYLDQTSGLEFNLWFVNQQYLLTLNNEE